MGEKLLLSTNSTRQDGFSNPPELSPGVRGSDEPPNQHGAVRFLCLHLDVCLLRQGRCRPEVLSKFFKNQSHEEREHAEKLMKFQNQRGGRVILQDVSKPDRDEWSNGLEAMSCALHLERTVNQSLLDLHKLASDKIDAQMCDFLETHYLDEQVQAIKKLGDLITNLVRLGAPQNGMAEYLFDKHSLEESS
ncbi:hypothetical protein scyTo_0011730 [Scyliorhinus torazame]|uniref:Ferritin n=1 Tax=Scyliorhinus torazame TaxID=75743 RepID=A0A401NTS3_SCYTO|nr:hypothetical protein [Scyliorhinus torazame]